MIFLLCIETVCITDDEKLKDEWNLSRDGLKQNFKIINEIIIQRPHAHDHQHHKSLPLPLTCVSNPWLQQ